MICVDCIVYFKIINARESLYSVDNIKAAVAELAVSVIRAAIGHYTLQELLEKRAELAKNIESQIEEYVFDWGVDVSSVAIKDIILNQDIQDAISSAAKEIRLAQAKVISAKADLQSAKLMREASDLLSSSAAMQIRYLETVRQLSQNSKMIFFGDDSSAN